MSSVVVGVRMPPALVSWLDRQIEKWEKKTPGVSLSRSTVARMLLMEAMRRSR